MTSCPLSLPTPDSFVQSQEKLEGDVLWGFEGAQPVYLFPGNSVCGWMALGQVCLERVQLNPRGSPACLPQPCPSLGCIFLVTPSAPSPWHQPSPMGSPVYSILPCSWHWGSVICPQGPSRDHGGRRSKGQSEAFTFIVCGGPRGAPTGPESHRRDINWACVTPCLTQSGDRPL